MMSEVDAFKLQEQLVDLYLSVKIRSNEEVRISWCDAKSTDECRSITTARTCWGKSAGNLEIQSQALLWNT